MNTNRDYYKDFYFIYVVTGANYIRPIKKSFEFIPKEANVVILTNTPDTLKDVKVDFNLIVDDLEKYRTDWSRENEDVIDIADEQAYMDEYARRHKEETYRYPMAIMRFGINWAIQNNITKLLLVDVGCKIGFDLDPQEKAFKLFQRLGKDKNLIIGHTWYDDIQDHFGGNISIGSPLSEVFKKHIPNYDADNYPKEVTIYDDFKDAERKKIGSVGFDGYCYGFWFHNTDLLKVAYNFWCDLVEKSYEFNIVQKNRYDHSIVYFEYQLGFIADLLTKYYNVLICPHRTIIRHFYHPENDFIDVNKMKHLNLIPAKTRKEFINLNRDKIESVNGLPIARLIIDEFDEN